MGCIIGHGIDYNRVGLWEAAVHTQQKLTQVPLPWGVYLQWAFMIYNNNDIYHDDCKYYVA